MMKLSFRILIGCIIIWSGIKAVEQAFGSYQTGLSSMFQFLPFILLILFTTIALLLDRSFYQIKRKWYQFIGSFIGIACCIIVIFKIFQRKQIENSKTLFEVRNVSNTENVLSFEFKTGNTFIMAIRGHFGVSFYYGNYSKKGDTLYILKNNYTNTDKTIPKKGIIEQDMIFWDNLEPMEFISKE